jgi:hypothetical protein
MREVTRRNWTSCAIGVRHQRYGETAAHHGEPE